MKENVTIDHRIEDSDFLKDWLFCGRRRNMDPLVHFRDQGTVKIEAKQPNDANTNGKRKT